jgi:Prealbumin-like fold domain
MKNLYSKPLLLLAITCFSACSKSNDNSKDANTQASASESPHATALQLTITDTTGNKIAGVTVELYANATDWGNKTNALKTGVTDENGIVKFDSLAPLNYYWFASLDCRNNQTGTYSTAQPLIENLTTAVTTKLYEKGSIVFVNGSADPYSIYVNGILVGTQDGNTTDTIASIPTGNYTVRVLQKTGYSGAPIDETFTSSITCGSTYTVLFP